MNNLVESSDPLTGNTGDKFVETSLTGLAVVGEVPAAATGTVEPLFEESVKVDEAIDVTDVTASNVKEGDIFNVKSVEETIARNTASAAVPDHVQTASENEGNAYNESVEGACGMLDTTASSSVKEETGLEGNYDDLDDEKGINSKWNKNGFGVTVAKQSGKFTKEESELVRKSVEEFCAAKQISTARLCSECDHKAELKGAWMEIAKRIPHRTVQSVYRHGIRRLHPFKRGAWTEAECGLLIELVARNGKKWSTIQGKLNRSADACRDKYREMSDDYIKGRWKEQETEILKRLIREQVGVEETTDLKQVAKIVEDQKIQIPWSSISKRMGKRSRLSCFKKWQKLTGVCAEEDTFRSVGGKLMTMINHDDDDVDDNHGDDKDEHFFNDGEIAPPNKRAKQEEPYSHNSVGAALVTLGTETAGETDDYESAKIADETVEALALPDTRDSFERIN